MRKMLNKLGVGSNFFNLIKCTYKKHDHKMDVFHLKSRTSQDYPLLPPLLKIVLEVQAKGRKRNNKCPDWKR